MADGYNTTHQPVSNSEKKQKHIQLALPMNPTTNLHSTYHAHVKMGQFYELLTKALFGGKLCDSVLRCNNGKRHGIKPDLLDNKNKTALESKANRSGHQMNLLDNQIESYRWFQIMNEDYTIYFVFYRHGYRRIKSAKESLEDLQKNLSIRTYAAIKLPFDIVYTMWKHRGFKRYEQKTWNFCTRINSPYMNLFLADPKKALSTLKVNLGDYTIGKFLSCGDLYIENCKMDEFLIVEYESKYYHNWTKAELIEKVPF